MGKKKPFEYGLDHVQKLGIFPAKDARGIHNNLVSKIGVKRANEFHEKVEAWANEKNADDMETIPYEFLYDDYDLAMSFCGSYDADMVRKACNWIMLNRTAIGKTILEVGCGCGFITSFLGRAFPDSHIIAIDRLSDAVEITKRNVEQFGLTNVDVICCDLKEIEETFDTVISSLISHENLKEHKGVIPVSTDIEVSDFVANSKDWAKCISPFVKEITKRVNANGNIISIDRRGHHVGLYGDMLAFAECGFVVDAETYRGVLCKEVDLEPEFQMLIYERFENDDNDDVFTDYIMCLNNHMDWSTNLFYGDDALVAYELLKGQFLAGFVATTDSVNQFDKVMLHSCETDDMDKLIVGFRYWNGEAICEIHDWSEKDELIDMYRNHIDAYQNQPALKNWHCIVLNGE